MLTARCPPKYGPLLACVLACADSTPEGSLQGEWQVAESRVGDTTIVQTTAGSAWGTAGMIEELRIGRLEGAEHEMFGAIGALAVTPGGEILVYDAQANAVRRYAPTGEHLGTLGRGGSGPGEYQNVAGMAVLTDGRIALNDFGNGRFTLFNADGTADTTWVIGGEAATMWPLQPRPNGGVYTHRRVRTGDLLEEALIALDAQGSAQDTVLVPHADFEPPWLDARTERSRTGAVVPFTGARHWAVTAAGEVVIVLGERYAIDLYGPDGTVRRYTRAVAPVPVSAAERDAEEANITARLRRVVPDWRWDGPPMPASKAPLTWMHTGLDGTIWVRVAQPGTAIPEAERTRDRRSWVSEPVVFEVFEPDGRFLGQVRGPDGMLLRPHPVLSRHQVWSVVQDGEGANVVVRFRVVPN